jgi:hypothetical protein
MPLQGHGDWIGVVSTWVRGVRYTWKMCTCLCRSSYYSHLPCSGAALILPLIASCAAARLAQHRLRLSLLVLIVATPLHCSRWPSLFWPLTPAQERPAGAECMQREDVGGSSICKNNCRASLRRQCVNCLARSSTTSLDHRYQRFSHLKRPCTAAPF